MPDLIAQGAEAQQRWRRVLPEAHPVVLGRAAGVWSVPWDHQVSRRHVRLLWNGQRLEVLRLPEGRNPIFFRGKEENRFTIVPGEHFVIGQTTFTLADQRVSIESQAPSPVQAQSFSPSYLKHIPFRNPDHRIEVLSRLPDVIAGAAGDLELSVRLVSMLLAGVPRADAAAIVVVGQPSARAVTAQQAEQQHDQQQYRQRQHSQSQPAERPCVQVLHWDQRLAVAGDFQPSQSLILEAIRQRQSVLHVWRGSQAAAVAPYTQCENFDWAFCTPIPGNSCPGWGLYVAGRFGSDRSASTPPQEQIDLREDLKFTELVAAMLGSLRQMRLLEHRQATLSQFFSPVVLDTLAHEDPEVVLAPRECTVSVMFCDLRGFSRESERRSSDLMELLQRVSNSLGIMTRHIREQGGVVGDLQGDAAMGFWGWPMPQDDAIVRTARAALAVRKEFQSTEDFHVGIGIATGKAVAGKIGSIDQVKVTVFGPVVNLASRLEGMTRMLRAPILIDDATASYLRRHVPPEVCRVRRLAVVRPYGLDSPLEVSELLPPLAEYPELTDEHLRYYERALDAFLAGRWAEAVELLHHVPAEDQVKDFLTVYIAQHNRRPPPNWDRVIPLGSK